MTIVTGTVNLGPGVPPDALNSGKSYIRARVTEIVSTTADITLLPYPTTAELSSTGEFSIDVKSIPDGWAYQFEFVIGNGRWVSPSLTKKVPASGTHKLKDLDDVVPVGHTEYRTPGWYADVLEARDDTFIHAGTTIALQDAAIASRLNASTSATRAALTRSGRKPSGDRDNMFHLEDFGLRGNDVNDDTRAWKDAIAAAAATRGHVALPRHVGARHIIGETLTIPAMVSIGPAVPNLYRFGTGATASDKVNAMNELGRPAGATHDLMRTTGAGVTIQGLSLHGGGSAGKAIDLVRGFEARLSHMRLAYFADTAFDVSEFCNGFLFDFNIDNCGTVDKPAMVLNPRNGRTINTLTAYMLRIERCAGIFLDIGPDSSNSAAPVEVPRFENSHFEAVNDNDGVPNTLPQIRINNAREVLFTGGYHYGGPGYLFEVERKRTNLLSAVVGVTLADSYLAGRNIESEQPAGTTLQPTNLVHLVSGDGFLHYGNTYDNVRQEPVLVESTFGAKVLAGTNLLTDRAATQVSPRRVLKDNRATTLAAREPNEHGGVEKFVGMTPRAQGSPLGVYAGVAPNGTPGIEVSDGTRNVRLSTNLASGRATFERSGMFDLWSAGMRGDFSVLAGLGTRVRARNADYTLNSDATSDDSTVLATVGGITLTLPTAVGIAGRQFVLKNAAATGNVTVATTSGQEIDAASSLSLTPKQAVTVQSDGANWWIIG